MTTSQTRPVRRGVGRTLKLWVVDVSLLAVFLLAMNVPLTGLTVHEWLGIAIGAGLVAHLVQHGNWLATVTHRLRTATSLRNRLNYIMTGFLFISFVSIIVSGLVISEAAVPWLGIETSSSVFWLWLHLVSVNFVLSLTALHIALNWAWITNCIDRFVRKPLRARSARRHPHLVYPSTGDTL